MLSDPKGRSAVLHHKTGYCSRIIHYKTRILSRGLGGGGAAPTQCCTMGIASASKMEQEQNKQAFCVVSPLSAIPRAGKRGQKDGETFTSMDRAAPLKPSSHIFIAMRQPFPRRLRFTIAGRQTRKQRGAFAELELHVPTGKQGFFFAFFFFAAFSQV